MVLDIDPHKFDDPIALQVDWSPVEEELLSALRLKRRTLENSRIIAFNVNYGSFIFYSLFSFLPAILCVGFLVLVVIGLISSIVQGDFDGISEEWIGFLIVLAMSLGFLYISFLHISELKRQRTKRSSFDLRSGHFMQGGLSYPINKIHALQLITKVDRGPQRTVIAHELNLIFADGRRRNVNDHENLRLIRRHACILADYLEIPIWDAVPLKYDL